LTSLDPAELPDRVSDELRARPALADREALVEELPRASEILRHNRANGEAMQQHGHTGLVADPLELGQCFLHHAGAGFEVAGDPGGLAVAPESPGPQNRRDTRAVLQSRAESPDALERVVHDPELLERDHEAEGELG